MTKQYTLAEVTELQTQKQQLEQRLLVHKQRAEEKQKELDELFAKAGVNNIQELSSLCSTMNASMQDFAIKEQQLIQQMTEKCDELDRML